MKRNTVKHRLDGLAALLLFAVFAVCILMVLLTGADAYRNLTQRDDTAHEERTCVQYITQRVRQADASGSIAVEDFGGADCLVLGLGEDYITRIYCWDGSLMELYSAPEDGLNPEDGEPILALESMTISCSEREITIDVTDSQGQSQRVYLALRGGERWSR